jgi:hypothetical protein
MRVHPYRELCRLFLWSCGTCARARILRVIASSSSDLSAWALPALSGTAGPREHTRAAATQALPCSKRVAHHEAGHFLIAYLNGLLPIAYTLSSLDAFRRFGALNVQAGCRFADAEFAREVRPLQTCPC